MDKRSELSKPVAHDYQIADACIADGHNENGKWVDWNSKLTRYCPPDWMVEEGKVTDLKHLYSQEYVSALLQRIADLEATQMTGPLALMLERLSVLERITEGVDQLAIDGGWTARGMSEYAKSLEQRLSTPVQLPDGLAKKIKVTGYYEALNEMMDCVRAAGFKCVGDE
jgi:hypothetical protein